MNMPQKKKRVKRKLTLVEHAQNEKCEFNCTFLEHYNELEDVLKSFSFKELTAEEAYEWFFNLDETEDETEMCSIQSSNKEPNRKFLPEQDRVLEKPKGPRTNKPNPIIYGSKRDSEGYALSRHFVLFRNDWREKLKKAQQMDFAITNLLAYYGGKNKTMRSGVCYGLILDLDGIDKTRLQTLLQASIFVDDIYPLPNAIALSGTGLHFYYLLEQPVNLTRKLREWLKWLKYNLIYTLWNSYTSISTPQFSSINQGFRLIGGPTKVKGLQVKVYEVNTNKWSLFTGNQNLSAFISPQTEELVKTHMQKPELPEIAPLEDDVFGRKRVTYEEAKELWPEWWERIDRAKREGREVQPPSFKVSMNFYTHWLKLVSAGASVGNRYYRIYTLSCVAAKCQLPFDELKKDADKLQVRFNLIGAPTFPFTESDEEAGLKGYYDPRATRYTYRQLCLWTHVPYNPKPKKPTPFKDAYYAQKELEALRNGEEYEKEKFTRSEAIKLFAKEKGELILRKKRANNPNFFANSGRKSAKATVEGYLRENPYRSVKACSKAFNLTPKTVRKYYVEFNGPLDAESAVRRFREENPKKTERECVEATGLSLRSVKSYWSKNKESVK